MHNLNPVEFEFIKQNIDYNCYLSLLRDCYEKNWRNKLPNRKYIKFQRYDDIIETQVVFDKTNIKLPVNIKDNCWVFAYKLKNKLDYIKLTPDLFKTTAKISQLNNIDFTALEMLESEVDAVIAKNKIKVPKPPKAYLGYEFDKTETANLKSGMSISITAKSKTGKDFSCDIKWQLNQETNEFEITPVFKTE